MYEKLIALFKFRLIITLIVLASFSHSVFCSDGTAQIDLDLYARHKYNISGKFNVNDSINLILATIALAQEQGLVSNEGIEWILREQELIGVPRKKLLDIKDKDFNKLKYKEMIEDTKSISLVNRRIMLYMSLMIILQNKSVSVNEALVKKIAKHLELIDSDALLIFNLAAMEARLEAIRSIVVFGSNG